MHFCVFLSITDYLECLKGLLLKKLFFCWQIGLVQTSFSIPWLPLKALPLTCYRPKDAYNIGPPGTRSLPPSDLKTCQVVTSKVPPKDLETCRLVCQQKLTAEHQAAGFQVLRWHFSGHHLAVFQVTRWQTSGPRGPNIMSTFLHVAGQWKGFGRQPRYC